MNNPIYPEVIRRTLAAISQMDLAALPAGELEIEGREIYLNHMIATTKPLYEQRPELHRYYIDIHILLEGSEVIGLRHQPKANARRWILIVRKITVCLRG